MDFDAVKRLLAALERERVQYAIFGAVAMGVQGLARFTEDLDLFIAPSAVNVDRLKTALRSVVDDPEIDNITAADLLGDYPAVQYVPPDGSFQIDILTRLGEAFAFADLETERLPFDGLTVSVVTPRGLYAMKRNTVRLKDRADAQALKERFGIKDEGDR
ncbi:MAG: nucleotidyl transferase AbiEii/AbiGii toxin family protein [Acidobacteriota bacterium]